PPLLRCLHASPPRRSSARIRSDPSDGSVKPGAPLRLALRVSRLTAGSCAPLPGAMVDVWHCDALGAYSDVSDPGGSTVGKKFLRDRKSTRLSHGSISYAVF